MGGPALCSARVLHCHPTLAVLLFSGRVMFLCFFRYHRLLKLKYGSKRDKSLTAKGQAARDNPSV